MASGLAIDYWPVRARLHDGRVLDRVVIAEHERFVEIWKIRPDQDPTKLEVAIGDVAAFEPSELRLPVELANALYVAGESGMGYQLFTIVLRDGRRLPRVSDKLVDFPSLPAGVTARDLADVVPHDGRDLFSTGGPTVDERGAPVHWCLVQGVQTT